MRHKETRQQGDIRLMICMPREFRHSVASASQKFGDITNRSSNIISLSVRGTSTTEAIKAVRKNIFDRTGIEVQIEEDRVQSINSPVLMSEEGEVAIPSSISSFLSRIFGKKKTLAGQSNIIEVQTDTSNIKLSPKLYNILDTGFPVAWRKGFLGKGVICGVNDTGYGINNALKPALNINLCDFSESMIEKDNDNHGHGTHVAGTIASSINNPFSIVGGAPESSIYVFKSGNGTFYTSDLIQGIDEAVKKGVNILNNSWGGYHSVFLQDAISDALRKGVIITKSIGNQDELSEDCYKDCVLVSAYTRHKHPALFSNFVSEKHIDNTIAAYGVDIFSLLPGNKYGFMSGTSMATPLVTAALALLIQKYPNKKAIDIIDILLTKCIYKTKKREYGVGLLNIIKEFEK